MRLKKFSIDDMRYETAKVSFQFDNFFQLEFELECHFNPLKKLLKGLIEIHEKDLVIVQLESIDMDPIDVILIVYPGGAIRVEFYEDVVWDNVDDLYNEEQPVPLISYFANWHDLVFAITEEYNKHTEEEFLKIGHAKPNEELKKLHDFMVGKK